MPIFSDRLKITEAGDRWYNLTKKELSVFVNNHWHNFGDVPTYYVLTNEDKQCDGKCNGNKDE